MACSLAFKSEGQEAKLVVSANCLTLNKHPLLFNSSQIKKIQPKEKTKANNQQKSSKDPVQRGFMTMK